MYTGISLPIIHTAFRTSEAEFILLKRIKEFVSMFTFSNTTTTFNISITWIIKLLLHKKKSLQFHSQYIKCLYFLSFVNISELMGELISMYTRSQNNKVTNQFAFHQWSTLFSGRAILYWPVYSCWPSLKWVAWNVLGSKGSMILTTSPIECQLV